MAAASRAAVFLWALLASSSLSALNLEGEIVQGGIVFGQVEPGSKVILDDRSVMVSEDGNFVIGFGRDETGTRKLLVTDPSGSTTSKDLPIAKRDYRIERVDGLPPKTVTPDPESLERIRNDARMVGSARARRDDRTDYAEGFIWPAHGRISGVYGSQRVLNGEPRRPHFGLDIAAPTGEAVYAPAGGIITMAHPDLYYSGGTIVLDHGQGLSSSFLHLSKVAVKEGDIVKQGDKIGEVGATGRATGPHLDWRMNWLNKRVDPQVLVKGDPPAL
jgi:murein DD-endopeptidase MepM/ murein hydrolase activator NlpD